MQEMIARVIGKKVFLTPSIKEFLGSNVNSVKHLNEMLNKKFISTTNIIKESSNYEPINQMIYTWNGELFQIKAYGASNEIVVVLNDLHLVQTVLKEKNYLDNAIEKVCMQIETPILIGDEKVYFSNYGIETREDMELEKEILSQWFDISTVHLNDKYIAIGRKKSNKNTLQIISESINQLKGNSKFNDFLLFNLELQIGILTLNLKNKEKFNISLLFEQRLENFRTIGEIKNLSLLIEKNLEIFSNYQTTKLMCDFLILHCFNLQWWENEIKLYSIDEKIHMLVSTSNVNYEILQELEQWTFCTSFFKKDNKLTFGFYFLQ